MIVADEIKYKRVLFVVEFTQPSTELLCKYDCRVCSTKHDYLIQRGDVDTLIENINGKQIFELTCFQLCNRSVPVFFGSCSRDSSRAIANLVQLF